MHRLPEYLSNFSFTESKPVDFCCEFCDAATVKATYMCQECGYWYCKSCLESMHQLKGPFANHSITEPKEKPQRENRVMKCHYHDAELEFYCLSCKDAACEKCRYQMHQRHQIESLQQYCEQSKVRNLTQKYNVPLSELKWQDKSHLYSGCTRRVLNMQATLPQP